MTNVKSPAPQPATTAGGFPAHPPATIVNTPTQPPKQVAR